MAGDPSGHGEPDTVPKLLSIAQTWILEYCMYHLWEEFRHGKRLSQVLEKTMLDMVQVRIPQDNEELAERFRCIRFICALCSVRDKATRKKESEVNVLQKCLSVLDEVLGIYPFSKWEKDHLRGQLKVQVILASYRSDTCRKEKVKQLYHKLFEEGTQDTDPQLHQEDFKNLLESRKNEATKAFLEDHPYEAFLEEVAGFLAPFWKIFDIPLLKAEKDILPNMEEDKIDGKLLKALHFALNEQGDDFEESWLAIVSGTHPDLQPKHRKSASSSATALLPADHTKPDSKGISPGRVDHQIRKSNEVIGRLKRSSKALREVLDTMKAKRQRGEGDVPEVDDNDEEEEEETEEEEQTTAGRKSPSPKPSNSARGRKRWMDPQPTAEEVEWSSDDDEEHDDILSGRQVIKLPPSRVLNVQLCKPLRQKRTRWTEEETEWLQEGVRIYGEGNWAKILGHYPFQNRTSVNLKDRWRNLNK